MKKQLTTIITGILGGFFLGNVLVRIVGMTSDTALIVLGILFLASLSLCLYTHKKPLEDVK